MDIKAFSDHSNYLDRMAKSLNESTKSLIPLYIKGKKKVLDVGCADGSMMQKLLENDPNIEVYGIDLCQESIDICESKGLKVFKSDINSFVHTTGLKFDAIIFSSVLHEISSYADKDKYSIFHIKVALNNAKKLLTDDGIIIIRDGLGTNDYRAVTFQFVNNEDYKIAREFIRTPIFSGHPWTINMCAKDSYTVTMSRRDFKEFLFTYTWGEKSWERESKERFGIMSVEEWIQTVKDVEFNIKFISTSTEQYVERLREKIECDRLEEILAESTITMILSKG